MKGSSSTTTASVMHKAIFSLVNTKYLQSGFGICFSFFGMLSCKYNRPGLVLKGKKDPAIFDEDSGFFVNFIFGLFGD